PRRTRDPIFADDLGVKLERDPCIAPEKIRNIGPPLIHAPHHSLHASEQITSRHLRQIHRSQPNYTACISCGLHRQRTLWISNHEHVAPTAQGDASVASSSSSTPCHSRTTWPRASISKPGQALRNADVHRNTSTPAHCISLDEYWRSAVSNN